MSTVEIKELFDESRFPSGWAVFTLILYSPVGIVLAVIRLFIALQVLLAAALLPELSVVRSFVLRSMCVVLGIVVKQEEVSNRDETVRLLVANHVTRCDHLAVHLVTSCVTPCTWEQPALPFRVFGMRNLGLAQGPEVAVSGIQDHLEKHSSPVLVMPEGGTTSGKVGLLKFSAWPFRVGSSVQPITIQGWRPGLIQVAPTALATSAWADIFWFLFSPCTIIILKYLPAMHIQNEEDDAQFAAKVEKAIADSLSVVATKHTLADKAEYEKRFLLEQSRPVMVSGPQYSIHPELQRMARQVGEVLPYVPHDAIVRDLVRTRSVDVTISNILEGQLHFTPLVEAQPTVVAAPVSSSPSPSPSVTAVASSSPQVSMENSFGDLEMQLMTMVQQNNFKAVEQIIKLGANINCLCEWNLSPLHVAVEHGFVNCVRALMRLGGDPDIKARITEGHHKLGMQNDNQLHEWTALHTAAMYDQPECIQILLESGADIHYKDENEACALTLAIRHDNPRCVELLIENGARSVSMSPSTVQNAANLRSMFYKFNDKLKESTSLHSVVRKGNHKQLNLMLRKKIDINEKSNTGETALHIAAEINCLKCGERLLQKGAHVNARDEEGYTALHVCVRNNHLEFLRLLIKRQVCINIESKSKITALHISASNGNKHIMQLLLENGANVNATDRLNMTPLHLSINFDHIDCLSILMEYKANIFAEDKLKMTALEVAARKGVQHLKMLMRKENINSKSSNELTPLHIVAAYDTACLDLLLEIGANVHAKTSCGFTPLHAAIKEGNLNSATTLIQKGANVNAEWDLKGTPLHISANEGLRDCLLMLLKSGASVNALNKSKETALHSAVVAGHVECMNSLLEFGLDINAVDCDENTILMLAAKNGRFDCVRVLLEHDALLWASE